MKLSPITLAKALGLRPLDRVQINNAHEIHEFMCLAKRGEHFDLPFFYFQRALNSGMIEVRSPGGYATEVDPRDICDIIRGEPVTVRAMPRSVFIERSRLSLADRQKAPSADCYSEAYVLYAAKDKWGGVDATVWFKDESLNDGKPFSAPVMDDDRAKLVANTKRTVMPVQNRHSSANYSADKGVERAQDFAKAIVTKMISASLKGNRKAVEVLTSIGDNKLGTVALRKIAA